MIVFDEQPLKKTLCDVSVGGLDEEAHNVSMHLPYGAIYDILREAFGEKIQQHKSKTTLK